MGCLRAPGGGVRLGLPILGPGATRGAGASPRLPCARAWACGGRLGGPPPPGARASEDYARAGAKWAASGRARVAHRLLLAAADAKAAAAYARAGNRLLVTAGALLG